MGQGESTPTGLLSQGTYSYLGHRTHVDETVIDELSLRLTNTFAEKCLTSLELYCFKSVFKSLAESESGLRYWSESSLTRYLDLPDALSAGPVIYQLCSYLGAFPFPSHAPAILTNEALLRVVVILTGRHAKVLRGGKAVWRREIWRGCAVFDRVLSPTTDRAPSDPSRADAGQPGGGEQFSASKGFDVDRPVNDIEDDDGLEYDDDEMVLAAFESMDAMDVFRQGDKADIVHAMIPSDNFLRLLELLLLIAPLGAQENVGLYGVTLDPKRLEGLRSTANCILASFGIEHNPGISYRVFNKVVSNTLPFLFDPFQPLFEHFLFSKDLDRMHARKSGSSAPESGSQETAKTTTSSAPSEKPPTSDTEPLLPVEGDIMDLNILSQLSFIFTGPSLCRTMRPLYMGSKHGFSMGQFEKSVFNWRAPSILLVSGTLIPPASSTSHARNFVDKLSNHRLPASVDSEHEGTRFTYGAYVPVPWKVTHKTTFSTSQTRLFQLSPVHDVFEASEMSTNYTYFNKPPATFSGVGFGSPLPNYSSTSRASSKFSSPGLPRHFSVLGDEHVPLGPVSLHIDDALEFACFTHLSAGGGSFHPSKLPHGVRPVSDWQDRFEIDALEVWGIGGSEVAATQREAWAWEEREAEARRRINLGTGDIDADRELLRMAGLIGGGGDRSGGSMW